MKMNSKYVKEKILLSSAVVYVIIALLCGGSIIHLHFHKKNVNSRKHGIEENRQMTEDMFSLFNRAQNNCNLFFFSKQKEYAVNFIKAVNDIQNYIDSLKATSIQMERIEVLDTIKMLMTKRVGIVSDLDILYDRCDAISSTNEKDQLKIIEEQIDTLIISNYAISRQIFCLIIDFHKQVVALATRGALDDVHLVYWTYSIFIVGSIILLVLISVLIAFKIKNVNKAHQMHLDIEQANRRTNEIYENQHKLLLSISHDVKTPISSIIGHLKLWQQGDEISQKEIAVMQHSGKHILALMENLLDYSCLNQGLMKVSSHHFSLHKFCNEVKEMFYHFALLKGVALDVNLNFDKNLQLYSDELKLKQIVINLLSNAFKYTLKGSVQFCVSYEKGLIHFEISDTGKGIPSEQIAHIYNPFMRVEENKILYSGSGLGLFVVKGIVELLKGEISIQSIVDKGTTAKVIIPAQEVVNLQPATNSKPKRILIIDDDLAFLSMIKKMLLKLGHDADTCYTMEQFEERMKQLASYDLILTDADMITFTGKDIMKKMKDKGINFPLFLMSGNSNLDYEDIIQSGFSGFLRKPVTVDALEQLLEKNKNIPTNHAIPSLEELFQGDKQAINNVLKAFVKTTAENITLLQQYVDEEDFIKIKQICHKMLPMFMQIGGNKDAVDILIKINKSDNKPSTERLLWKEDIKRLIELSKEEIRTIFD